MPIEQYVIDAFSRLPFSGNPAAVVPLPQWPSDAWMQDLAAENNLSETAFVVTQDVNEFAIRWFTPTTEVDLCGHATLASAHALWSSGSASGEKILFQSASGPLVVTRSDDKMYLDFPANPVHHCPVTDDDYLQLIRKALDSKVFWAGSDGGRLIAEVADADTLEQLAPSMEQLLKLKEKTIIVSSAKGGEWVCRVFAPRAGINEDPVTGSAYTALVPHWHAKSGDTQFTAQQLSTRRGTVYCTYQGDRVLIGGHAVTISQGVLLIDPFARKLA